MLLSGLFCQVQQPLLMYQEIVAPLLKTIQVFSTKYSGAQSQEQTGHWVALLSELSERLVQEPSLASLFIAPARPVNGAENGAWSCAACTLEHTAQEASFLACTACGTSRPHATPSTHDVQDEEFWLLAALIPLMYTQGNLGTEVRNAILRCIKFSRTSSQV